MIDVIGRTRGALTSAYRLSVRAQVATDGHRLAVLLLALLLSAMAFDLLFPLPGALRGLFVIGWVVSVFHTVLRLRGRLRREAIRLEQAALLLERKHPELENALINAVQFSAALNAQPDTPSSPLMRREIDRAEREVGQLSPEEVVDRTAIARSRRTLLALLAGVALSMLIIPRAYRFEIPRFLLFWADYPPFTLTDFSITPRGARIKAGGSVTLEVRVSGLLPERLALVTQTGKERERSTALYTSEEGVYRQTLENLRENTWYYVRANTGRSARYQIQVDQAPRVRRISVTIHPPAYTKRPAETMNVEAEGIRGLYGTKIDIVVEATRHLESGRLTLRMDDGQEEKIELRPLPGQSEHVGGSFVLRRDGAFRVDLIATDGLSTRDAARGPLRLLRDEKPLVYLTVPGRNAVVTPDMRMPLRTEAEDDVAVQRLELHRIVNNLADTPQRFPVEPGRPRADATLVLDLKDLGVRPGDVIQYYATAYDNDPGTPHLTDSERYWLWVVSPEDYRRLLAQQRGLTQLMADYRALTDALKTLAEDQRALAKEMEKYAQKSQAGGAQMEALQKAQANLRRQAEELAREMRRLAEQKPQYDIEKGLQKKLAELANRLARAAGGAMKSAEQAKNPNAMVQQGEQAAQQLERASGGAQRSIEKALQALEKTAPLYQDLERLKQLTQKQGETAMQARQVARLAKLDDFAKSRLTELPYQQEQIRQQLRQLLEDMDIHANECAEVAPGAAQQAKALTQAIDRMGVPQMMAGAQSAFRKPDTQTGANEAERAQRALESLLPKCKICQGQAKQGLEGQAFMALGQGAGSTLDQLGRVPGTQGGQGQGFAQGQGGMPAPQPGSRPGDGSQLGGSSQTAMALPLYQPNTSSSARRENRRRFPGADQPGELGAQDIERLTEATRKPPAVTDPAPGRYPAEYRRLVKEYFRAVADGQ